MRGFFGCGLVGLISAVRDNAENNSFVSCFCLLLFFFGLVYSFSCVVSCWSCFSSFSLSTEH